MPFFFLPPDKIKFPPAHFADLDGLLAQGGDLTGEWIIEGLKSGVYLWSSPMEPLRWWSPDPRLVVFPDRLNTGNDIEKHQEDYSNTVVINKNLEKCLDLCENIENKGEMNPKWLTVAARKVYLELEGKGLVENLQVWQKDQIKACAFGVLIGKMFFTEYVCSLENGLGETAFLKLAEHLLSKGIKMMDVQKETNIIEDIGIQEITRNEYIDLVKRWAILT